MIKMSSLNRSYMKFVSKHFKNILLILAALFIIFLLKDCRGRKKYNAAIEKANRDLLQKARQDSISNAQAQAEYQARAKDAEGRKLLAETEVQDANRAIGTQQRIIDRLAATIRNTPTDPPAAGIVVTRAYKDACDSLPAEIDKLNTVLVEKDSAISAWSDILAYEIQIRDEEIYRQMNYIDTLRIDFNRQTQLLRSSLQQGKPRGKLLGGLGVMGNEQKILAGANIKLAYQSRSGKQYQVSAHGLQLPGMTGMQVVYEGAVLFTIFK